jgi:hypothetical protein
VKNALRILTLLVASLSLTGCGAIGGHWKMKSIEPRSAADDFALQSITFYANGTFVATASVGGRTQDMTGRYEYGKEAHRLTFFTTGDPPRTYRVEICGACGTMDVSNAEGPTRWTAQFRRR